ncbi:hypothetical protein PZA11_001576 [Diplocarpon coronariae]
MRLHSMIHSGYLQRRTNAEIKHEDLPTAVIRPGLVEFSGSMRRFLHHAEPTRDNHGSCSHHTGTGTAPCSSRWPTCPRTSVRCQRPRPSV